MEEFVRQAWPITSRKVSKRCLLEDIYRMAQSSIGLPVEEGSEAVAMFRVILGEMIRLCQLRNQLAQRAALHLKGNTDFQHLQQDFAKFGRSCISKAPKDITEPVHVSRAAAKDKTGSRA